MAVDNKKVISKPPVGKGISVYGQFRIFASVLNSTTREEKGGFLETDTFHFLTVDERAGFRLPMMRLGFSMYDYSLLKYLNQGNILRIEATSQEIKDKETNEPIGIAGDFLLLKPEVTSDGNIKNVVLTGVLNTMGFLDDRHSRTFRSANSKQVFQWVADDYFLTDMDDGTDPDDRQNWIQSNLSDKDFFKHLFMYSNYPDSFPIIGITSNGKFRHRNFKSHVSNKEPLWDISFSPKSAGDGKNLILHNGNVQDVSNAGVMNLWRGAGVVVPTYNLDAGGYPTPLESTMLPGLLSGMSRANIRAGATPTILPSEYLSENMHVASIESKTRNVSGATLYSSQIIRVNTAPSPPNYVPVEVLDVVNFREAGPMYDAGDEGGKSNPELSNATTNGKYVVSRVTRHLTITGLDTGFELCREAPSEQLGGLR